MKMVPQTFIHYDVLVPFAICNVSRLNRMLFNNLKQIANLTGSRLNTDRITPKTYSQLLLNLPAKSLLS